MAKRKAKGLVRNVCSVCGKEFFSKQKAQFCVDNSTCRVKAHQAKRIQTQIAKSLMMDMDTYKSYLWYAERYPDLKEKFDALVFELGTVNFAHVMNLMTWVLLEDRKKLENDLHPTQ